MRVNGRSWPIKIVAGNYRYVEGPILDRLYELRLITWSAKSNIEKSPDFNLQVRKDLRKLKKWGRVGDHRGRLGIPNGRNDRVAQRLLRRDEVPDHLAAI